MGNFTAFYLNQLKQFQAFTKFHQKSAIYKILN